MRIGQQGVVNGSVRVHRKGSFPLVGWNGRPPLQGQGIAWAFVRKGRPYLDEEPRLFCAV